MAKTKYQNVYQNNLTGAFYYNVELGVDRITGKRIQKKASRSSNGLPFKTAREAFEEVTRIKNEYHKNKGYSNYNITYSQFMDDIYLKYYKGSVEESTWENRKHTFKKIVERFGSKRLRDITIVDCESYRTYLISNKKFATSYSSMIYGTFRKTLDYAVQMQYLDKNVSRQTKAIPKGKSYIPFWEKEEFEQVLSTFCLDNFYEHFGFVSIWLYYVTGIRVSEGLALQWKNINFKTKKMQVFNNLEFYNNNNYKIKPYTKTESGRRIISLDDDTIKILEVWKQRQEENGLKKFVLSYKDIPLRRQNINNILDKHTKLADVTRIQAKGLRHSHASYLINEHNADILVVSRRLGHSSPEITLKHYAHLWSRNDEGIADMITGNINISTAKRSIKGVTSNQYINHYAFK